jgi:hypothetical protein
MRRHNRSWRRGLVAPLLLLLAGGCAKISAPVGGVVDREPPRVLATDPEPFAVVEGWDGPVVIRFDERISEKRIQESILVSPETGAARIKKGRSELRVSLEGGWRPGQIYRVVVLPVLQDLFNNPLREEIELIFSTGPEIPATVLAGLATDRLTGKPAAGARVEALNQADSTKYVALSDTAGFFALRHIPAGAYEMRSYLDRNRSGRLDYSEPQDSGVVTLGAADTTIVSYALLPADTTPARLVRAEERDSLQLRLTLDDYLDPLESLAGVRVEIRELPDSIPVEGARVMHVHEFERSRAEERAAEAAVRAAADTVPAAEDTHRAPAGAIRTPAGAIRTPADAIRAAAASVSAGEDTEPATAEAGEPLPVRELVVIPEVPLARKTRYWIAITGVRNINGIEGGEGSVVFETAAAAQPDSAGQPPADSLGVAPSDSTRGDTRAGGGRTPADSSGVVSPPGAAGSGPATSRREHLFFGSRRR